MRENTYALYRGDDLLGIGTAKELAEAQGVRPETIKFYATPVYQKRANGSPRRLAAVKIEKE